MAEEKLQTFPEIIDRILIFIARPQIEDQLLVMGLVVVISVLLCFYVWEILCKLLNPLLDWTRSSPQTHTVLNHLIYLLKALTFPMLGLFLGMLAETILQYYGYMQGLLTQLKYIFYTIIGFEIVMAVFYSNFRSDEVRHYRYRFHMPLLIIVVSYQLISKFVDMPSLAAIVVIESIENPITVGTLGIATLGLYFWTHAINIIYSFLFNFQVKFTKTDKGAAQAALTLIRYLLIALGVYYVFDKLRLDSTTVAAITAGLSVGVGFALREVLSNFVSGILLLFERSLHPQDVIEVDGMMAVVQSLKVRATIVRTIYDEELVIPNQKFLTDSFKTYTGSDKKVRISVLIKTSYDNDLLRVIELIKTTAVEHPKVLDKPAPDVWVQDQFSDNSVTFKLLMTIDRPMLKEQVKSEVIQDIWRTFKHNNVSLTFPGMELFFEKPQAKVSESLLASCR